MHGRLRLIQMIGSAVTFSSSCQLLRGQEAGAPSWDPRETGQITMDWQTGLYLLGTVLTCGALWKAFMWFLESRRASIAWARLRFWWPASMLIWGWIIVAFISRNGHWGQVFDVVCLVYFIISFPALILVAAILSLLGQPRSSLGLPIASVALWAGDYLLVRLAEWRAWATVPTLLHLGDFDVHIARR